MSEIRTRFAPSPTGMMHVGGVRTALYAWLYARQHKGKFILRIEDTDKAREIEGSIGHIMESLKWLGIDWDESLDIGGPYGPYIQSDRLPLYRKYAEQLLTAGFAYPDPYSETDVEAFREEARAAKKPFLFREHRPEQIEEWDGKAPLRFKTPVIKRYEWQDAVFGPLSAGEEALDDFILLKSDGYPTYNFAHVVDDIEMKITHIMRGQEFVASTPKFLSLYDALDTAPPIFATLPPILGEGGGKKLGKRDGAKDLLEYRDEGYLPEAMVNFLALLGWHPSHDEEVLSRDDLLRDFSLERVQKSGARFDEDKLNHLNREHLRKLTDIEFMNLAGLKAADEARLRRAIPSIRERVYTLAEANDLLSGELAGILGDAPTPSKEGLLAKAGQGSESSISAHLEAFSGLIEGLSEDMDAEAIKAVLMPYADAIPKEQGGRGVALWPLRYALSAMDRSPDPFTLIYILGPTESLSRVQKAIAILSA